MTGPEHYREAEELMASASLDYDHYKRSVRREAAHNLAAAQVHATLALAAATIDAAAHPNQSQVDYLGEWWAVQR